MKLLIDCFGLSLLWIGLVSLVWHAEICQSFLPLQRPKPVSVHSNHRAFEHPVQRDGGYSHGAISGRPSSRLCNGVILIVEEDDDEENGSNNKNYANAKGDGQSIEFIIDIDGPISISGDSGHFTENRHSPSTIVTDLKAKLKQSSPPPLTTMKRARIETEIDLLKRLSETADETTVQKLSTFWATERGPDAAKVLRIADAFIKQGHPVALRQGESILLSILQDHGVQWVAPFHSLATLYARMGHLQESKELYGIVLSQKPWHWESLAGVHQVCRKLNDYDGLGKWDREILPEEDVEMRKQWATRMVAKAQERLTQAEQGLYSFLDSGHDRTGSEGSILIAEGEEGGDAWQ